MKYDYYESLKQDIKDYLEDNKEYVGGKNEEELYDDLFLEDSVTGNASGSYTFSTWQAEENICHNMDLLREAQSEFGFLPTEYISKGAEWADVTIRCYLLGQVLHEVLEEMDWECE